MQEYELDFLWYLFLKSGDIRLYNLYREFSEEPGLGHDGGLL